MSLFFFYCFDVWYVYSHGGILPYGDIIKNCGICLKHTHTELTKYEKTRSLLVRRKHVFKILWKDFFSTVVMLITALNLLQLHYIVLPAMKGFMTIDSVYINPIQYPCICSILTNLTLLWPTNASLNTPFLSLQKAIVSPAARRLSYS